MRSSRSCLASRSSVRSSRARFLGRVSITASLSTAPCAGAVRRLGRPLAEQFPQPPSNPCGQATRHLHQYLASAFGSVEPGTRRTGPPANVSRLVDRDAVAMSDDLAARDLGRVGNHRLELLVADPCRDDIRGLLALLLRSVQDRKSERTPCCAQVGATVEEQRAKPRRPQRQPTRSVTVASI